MIENNETSAAHEQDELFLESLPLIRSIAIKRSRFLSIETVEDIVQRVALKIWYWRTRRNKLNLTRTEWKKLANTATCNEIRSLYRKDTEESRQVLPLEAAGRLKGTADSNNNGNNLDGNSNTEVRSVLLCSWALILKHSFMEKYSLLLQKDDLLILLLMHGCCCIEELASELGLTNEEFASLIGELPLPDKDIAGLIAKRLAVVLTPKDVVNARYRINTDLKAILLEKNGYQRASVARDPGTSLQGAAKRRRTD